MCDLCWDCSKSCIFGLRGRENLERSKASSVKKSWTRIYRQFPSGGAEWSKLNSTNNLNLKPAMDYSLPRHDLEQVTNLAGSDFSAFKGSRIFLTGGTGFFGRWLTESWGFANVHLQLQGELHILSRNPDAFLHASPHLREHQGIYFHRGDQGDFDFPKGKFDAIIHCAVEHGLPTQTFLRNLEGTWRALEFARAARATRFLLLSSGAIYGRQPSDLDRIPESFGGAPDVLEASSAYGLVKRAGEFLSSEAMRCGGAQCMIARGFAFIGPGLPLDRNYAIGNFIRDAMVGGPIQITGDGTPLRSYLYASDMAVWVWGLLARGMAGRAYNVGSPEAISILHLAELVRDVICPGCTITVREEPDPARPVSRYVPDTSRAEMELGLKRTVTLEEAIRRTAAWVKA